MMLLTSSHAFVVVSSVLGMAPATATAWLVTPLTFFSHNRPFRRYVLGKISGFRLHTLKCHAQNGLRCAGVPASIRNSLI